MKFNAVRRAAAVLALASLAGLAQAGTTVLASPDSFDVTRAYACDAPLTGVDARVMDKARSGVDALRDYLSLTQGIYQLSMANAVAWIDRMRDAQARCQLASAGKPR